MPVGELLPSVVEIAYVCHEANRAYQQVIGDLCAPPWMNASQEMRDNIIKGVQLKIDRPDVTDEEMHAAWSENKKALGWVYGDQKDETLKTHPCLVDYEDLPEKDRIKDALFKGIVTALVAGRAVVPFQNIVS